MADIGKEEFRQIGIGLINEYRQQRGFTPIDWLVIDTPEASAFIRSIQLHEKTKKELQGVKQELHDFRQEVSDAVGYVLKFLGARHWAETHLNEFIIPKPKPDPLVQVLDTLGLCSARATEIHTALSFRGFEIREKGQ